MRAFRWLLRSTLLILFVAAAGYAVFRAADPETRDITPTIRSLVPGSFVRLTDGVTHYELAGPTSGDVVVLAAGATVPYYIWYPTFKVLVDSGFRVLRYDYYGRGYSDRPEVDYNEALYVRQLHELLDSLHIARPVNLAGLSFGGSVVTSFADRYPDRVKRLIYIDPFIRHGAPASLVMRVPLVRDVAALLVDRAAPTDQLKDFLHPSRFPSWPTRYRPQLQYRGFRHSRIADAADRPNLDQQAEIERLGREDRPVLIVWGMQDTTVPIAASQSLRDAMPRSEFVAVDSAGHLPIWEQPRVVHPALLAFLRK